MSASNPYHEDQFLRRAFDFAYQITPGNIRRFYQGIPPKARWMFISTAAAFVLVIIALQLTHAAIDAYQWANRPALETRIIAPFGMEQRQLPPLNTERHEGREMMFVDTAALNAEREAALAAAREEAAAAMEVARAEYEAEIAASSAEAVVDDAAAVAEGDAVAGAEGDAELEAGVSVAPFDETPF